MQPTLSCSDYTFPLLSHDHALDLVAMLGFTAVDIGLFEDRSHLWPSRVFLDLEQNAHALRRKLCNRGLKLADLFLQTALEFVSAAPNHPDAAVRSRSRELFVQACEFTAQCGGGHITALPGALFGSEPAASSLARCVEELSWRVRQAREFGLVFSVEAHLGSIAPTPGDALALVRAVEGLTLTLDYTHFIKQGYTDANVEPLIAHASHFHARGAAPGQLQTAVKDSTIDYRRVVRCMREKGYTGCICIEYTWSEWEDCNRTDNLSETVLLRDEIAGCLIT